ncbi:MAG: TRZ/ATZ family hydrolase [Betaproteobacteria bacterium]|nr:TRZ/ATZ family hydrolase [Betaproteobacteria bacterium]
MPQSIDTLIEARWIIPVEPHGVTLEQHAVAVDAGRIVALLPAEQAHARFLPRHTLRLQQHVLLPGLINLHTHAAMSLLRGYADDMVLMDWLKQRIWPAEARHVSADFVYDGALLACAEMLRGGITCFNDMYFHPQATAEAALRMGMRAVLGILTVEFPTAYAADADDYLTKGLAVRNTLCDEPLISFCMAPHAPYSVSDKTFERIATLAAQLDLPIHIHIHETQAEIHDGLKQYGVRPLERLHRLGLLGPNLIVVHAVHLEPGEVDLLANQGCAIAHCPTSNMKLASGIAPIAAMSRRGLRIGLGSDGAACNNRLDLFREMNHAALLAKAASGDASVLDAHTVLRMATLDGAAALGLERQIGSLVEGKQADLCAVRLDDPSLLPCFNPASHLIHVVGREHVSHVWVAGKACVTEGRLQAVEAAELLDIANMWHNKLDF